MRPSPPPPRAPGRSCSLRSHRSTQKSKKGPFVTHYYDCRLKGRPPGTPVNQDPNKKKRKRTARERDLCEMKIKIIESTAPVKSYTIEKVKREIGANGEEPAGEYHRHSLEESDRIKRNSVQRQAIKLEKEIKKVQVRSFEPCFLFLVSSVCFACDLPVGGVVKAVNMASFQELVSFACITQSSSASPP